MCCLLHFLYETVNFFKCVSFTIDYRLEFNDRQHCHSNIVFLKLSISFTYPVPC